METVYEPHSNDVFIAREIVRAIAAAVVLWRQCVGPVAAGRRRVGQVAVPVGDPRMMAQRRYFL
jgi:hypothetical protein